MKLNINKIAAKMQHTAYIEETRVHHDTNYRMVAIFIHLRFLLIVVLLRLVTDCASCSQVSLVNTSMIRIGKRPILSLFRSS